jgi:hypothetical protein
MGYGFTFEDNPTDSFGLSVPIPDSPQKRYALEILEQGKELCMAISREQLGIGNQTINREFDPPPDVFYLTVEGPLPKSLLDTVGLSVANERELEELGRCQRIKSRRLLIQTYGQLYLGLSRKYRNITSSVSYSTSIPKNERQKHAQQYVRGQVKILDRHLSDITDIFAKRAGMEYLFLDDLLQSTLSELKSVFRSLCRKVLATRNPEKLRKQGHEDSLFAIFICLCWIRFTETQGVAEKNSGLGLSISLSDESPAQGLEGSLPRWLQLLRGKYCPPPGWTGQCHGINCTCNDQPPQDLAEDDVKVGNAYAIIHRALLTDELQNTLGGVHVWTRDYLHWGLNIWKAEAVFVPQLQSAMQPARPKENTGIYSVSQQALYLEPFANNYLQHLD